MDQTQRIKELLKEKLAKIFCSEDFSQKLGVTLKKDKSLVTEVDLFVSDLVKKELQENYSHFSFFSEEDKGDFSYPMIILDPIDGTIELSNGIGECSLSLAIAENNRFEGEAWIYNPFTGFEVKTDHHFVDAKSQYEGPLLGMVSRTEYNSGLFKEHNQDLVQIVPRGSIAFKLGLLATGACDFVISLRPKNIWDIAAGTMLCKDRGILFYEGNEQIKTFDKVKYENPLIWCKAKNLERIKEAFSL